MIRLCKIPKSLKGTPVMALDNICVFGNIGLIRGGAVVTAVHAKEKKKRKLFIAGYYKSPSKGGVKTYWCKYGFLNDDIIYAKK